MPIYEYECGDCGHKLEAIQKLSDAPLTDCPDCGEQSLRKLVSAAAFRLKGSGWYETDFKSGKKNDAESKQSKDTSGTKSGSKSESSSAPASCGAGCGCH